MTAKRGRVSMAELMTPKNALEKVERPDAPYELNDEESDEWRAITQTMSADHFMRANYPLLVQYCRHIVSARRIQQLITAEEKKKKFDRREYMILLQMRSTETAQIHRLARSMRLTQQSVRSVEKPHPKGSASLAPPPWDKSHRDQEDAE
jgi:hypothetical protein